MFEYDAQGRIVAQHRAKKMNGKYGLDEHPTGGEYSYYSGKNRLKSVADNMGGTSVSGRIMSATNNFVYDSEGNLTEDKSKRLEISYDWRGMPVEFRLEPTGSSSDNLFRLTMSYDGSGRRISKTRWVKNFNSQEWEKELVTHYTGIGTEVREDFSKNQTKVVVNMPEGFGRYGIEDAAAANANASKNFEWYLKNHLGSTMLVYGTVASANPNEADVGTRIAAYDYRAFGEMLELTPPPTDKVTENFTGKELDEEIALSYFGARYLDPMLGMWISVDPKRQFSSPYLYAGNGYNPVNGVDPDGNAAIIHKNGNNITAIIPVIFSGEAATPENIAMVKKNVAQYFNGEIGKYNLKTTVVAYDKKLHGKINNLVILKENCASGIDPNAIPEKAVINVNSDRNILHEFGHLLGLDDKYVHTYQLDPNYGKPYKGYETNLMGGEHGETDFKPSQIEEMWGPGPIDPQNLYKLNDVIEE
ncbi:MAG: RHS repeat-associated core domain-containing protein [Fibrobacter sp.]|nr:RHS repeat-associated core domain-containing protein [Fibrobacter sp.]